MKLLPSFQSKPSRQKLESVTVSGFGGGWNTVESDLVMDTRSLVTLSNFRRTPSGGQKVRFGSRWFVDVRDKVSGDIVDMDYFADSLVNVTEAGEIAAVNNEGVAEAIWNTAIAFALPGTPTGWSSGLDSIDFVSFRDELLIHNGIDKPLKVDGDLVVGYLADGATGSNTNTPIGKYGCVVQNYHCVAGIPNYPTTVYISSLGTSGTFPGDPDPNDALSIDVGAYAPEGAAEIRGIAGFRAYLIVFFHGQSLVVKLGTYNDAGDHIPEFPDAMPKFGLLGHRCIVQIENDLLFAGLNGIGSAERNLFSGLVESSLVSEKIEPTYRGVIGEIEDEELLKSCFITYDSLSHDLVLHTPSDPEHFSFVWSSNKAKQLKYASWSSSQAKFWRCGCASFRGRLFFADGSRIFEQGNTVFLDENYAADRIDDRDSVWMNGVLYEVDDLIRDGITEESYTCIVSHISGPTTFAADRNDQQLAPKWELYLGNTITSIFELPWIAGKDRMKTKHLKFINFATKGSARFRVDAYVDNLYKNEAGEIIYDPALTMWFQGNDAVGFGNDAGPYGGGRRSGHPGLYKFPVKFKTLKLLITVEDTKALELTAVSFLYSTALYKRTA